MTDMSAMGVATPSRRGRRRLARVLKLAALGVVGVLLLSMAVSSVREVRSRAAAEVEGVLSEAASHNASSVETALLTADQHVRLIAQQRGMQTADLASQQLAEALSIGGSLADAGVLSTSVVDRSGRALIQASDGVVTRPASGPSPPEIARATQASQSLPVGVVHRGSPLSSPVADHWVLPLTTRLPGSTGRTLVVLLDLKRIRTALSVADERATVRLIALDGTVVASNRVAPPNEQPVGPDGDRNTLRSMATSEPGLLRADGQAFRSLPLESDDTTANRWWVVTSMPSSNQGLLSGPGISAMAIAVAAAILFVLGILSLRRHRANLTTAHITDPLTGLLNRGALHKRGTDVLEQNREGGYMAAVLCIAVGGLREVNESLGHPAGDRVLREVSNRLESALRASDLVIRLGGDEFAVLISQVSNLEGARTATRSLLDSLHRPIELDGHRIGLQAIAGLALAPRDGSSIEDLVERASRAMYETAGAGTDLAVYSRKMVVPSLDRLVLNADLRDAVSRDDLRATYRPIISVSTGGVIAVDVDLRWDHPSQGPLGGSDVFALGDGIALVLPIYKRLLDLALGQCRVWLNDGLTLPVTLRVPGAILADPTTVGMVSRALVRWQVPPPLLRLRIDQQILNGDEQRADTIAQLATLGVMLAADDYRPGSASLARITGTGANQVWLSATTVDRLRGVTEYRGAIQAASSVAHSLGMTVVAADIDDPEIIRDLHAVECDAAVGGFLCPAMSDAEFYAWLSARNRRGQSRRPPDKPATRVRSS